MEKASPGKESTKRGMRALALALALVLALFALIATSLAAAQSTETPDPESPDPLELYDENDNGVIDADEAIAATADHLDGNIDRDLASRVWDLYLADRGQVTGQSRPAACVEYDHNGNGVIDQDEVQAASDDYFAGIIDSDTVLAVIGCYFADLPPPPPTATPTPVPPTPTPTPDPLALYDGNEDGVIDGDELLNAVSDYFAGRIDRALALRVFRLYKAGAGASSASGESRAAVCDDYDANNNGVVDRHEVLKGVENYFDDTLPPKDRLTRDEAISLVQCYFGDPAPPPTGLVLSIESGDDDGLDLAFARSGGSFHHYEFELHRSTSQDGTYSVVTGATQNASASPVNFDDQDTGRWYKARGRNSKTSSRLEFGDWSDWSNVIQLPVPTRPPQVPSTIPEPTPRPVVKKPTGVDHRPHSAGKVVLEKNDAQLVLYWDPIPGVMYEVEWHKGKHLAFPR